MDAAPLSISLRVVERFAIHEAPARAMWRTPFDADDHYDLSWDSTLHSATPPRERYFSASVDDIEVARVLIVETDSASIATAFHLPATAETVIEVEWLEVARGHRRRGIGMAVIRNLERIFTAQHLIAFGAIEAEQFWDATGWMRYERDDRRLSSVQRPLHLRAPEGSGVTPFPIPSAQ
jgi:GNAT superfamily N-acetyltransferase